MDTESCGDHAGAVGRTKVAQRDLVAEKWGRHIELFDGAGCDAGSRARRELECRSSLGSPATDVKASGRLYGSHDGITRV